MDVWTRVRRALEEGRYLVGVHAAIRLRQRRIEVWQVVAGTLAGRLLVERPRARPNPVVEVAITLPDGTEAKAVWAWLRADDEAKLVTVHFFDR